nr:hypothetical protein [Chlamydiota bacterium]
MKKIMVGCLGIFVGIAFSVCAMEKITQDQQAKLNKAFIEAVKKNEVEEVKQLLDNGVDVDLHDQYSGQTALIIAAQKGYVASVKMLLDKGANAGLKCGLGDTALIIAVRCG